jgi:uncharacterized protein (DUF433 family)
MVAAGSSILPQMSPLLPAAAPYPVRSAHSGRMTFRSDRVDRITINPNRMRGLACIRDTRVTVSAVLGQLGTGQTVEQVLADYPYLEFEDILAALAFAAEAMQERELPLAQPA